MPNNASSSLVNNSYAFNRADNGVNSSASHFGNQGYQKMSNTANNAPAGQIGNASYTIGGINGQVRTIGPHSSSYNTYINYPNSTYFQSNIGTANHNDIK